MKKVIFFEEQLDDYTRPYKTKSVISTVKIVILCIILLLGCVIFAYGEESGTKKRSGLYSKAPTETTTSAPTSSDATGLYSPLRASGDLGAGGRPGIDDGIGASTPIGEAPKALLFVSALIYLSLVFIRKQNKLRVKN